MTQHRSFCRVCHNSCPILVEVEAGRAVSVIGDVDAPVHHGYVCTKGRAIPDIENSPTRLLHSMKRTAEGGHVPIASSVALDEIAERLAAILAEHGPRSIAFYGGTKMMTSAPASNMLDALFDAIGSKMRFTSNTIDQGGKAIAKGLHGYWLAPPQAFDEPECVLTLGANGLVTYGGLATGDPGRFIRDLGARGARTIVIDPRRTQLAGRATLHLQARPGQDVAILACMIRTILTEDLYDMAFVEENVTGLDQLRAAVEPFTPAITAQLAGVSASDLVDAARMFAGARRGYAVAGTGPNMGGGYGTLVEYLVLVIDTICGHYLRAGERVRNPGTLLPTIPAIAQAAPPIPAFGYGDRIRTRDHLGETLAGPPTAALPEEILTPGDGKVRVLFVLGGNPASAWPDQLTSIAALRDLDLLVTIDPEMTLTAQLAHYVIAPTTPLEMAGFTQLADMLLFYGNGVSGFEDAAAQYSPAITTRPEGSDLLEDWEVFYGIAQRIGMPLSLKAGAHFVPGSPDPIELDMTRHPTTEELMDILAGGCRIPLDQIRAADGQQLYPSEVVVAPKSPGWEFRLDVGNADMMRDLSATAGSEPAEDPEHRYRLIVRRLPHVVNSAHNIDATNRGRPFNVAHLHPDDLTDLGLRADDVAEIRSTRAAIHAVVAADATLRRGLISLPHCFGAMPGSDEDPRVDGGSAGRLLSIDEIYDRYSGQPLMSNIPVSISKVS